MERDIPNDERSCFELGHAVSLHDDTTWDAKGWVCFEGGLVELIERLIEENKGRVVYCEGVWNDLPYDVDEALVEYCLKGTDGSPRFVLTTGSFEPIKLIVDTAKRIIQRGILEQHEKEGKPVHYIPRGKGRREGLESHVVMNLSCTELQWPKDDVRERIAEVIEKEIDTNVERARELGFEIRFSQQAVDSIKGIIDESPDTVKDRRFGDYEKDVINAIQHDCREMGMYVMQEILRCDDEQVEKTLGELWD